MAAAAEIEASRKRLERAGRGYRIADRGEFKLHPDEEEVALLVPDAVTALLRSRGCAPQSEIVRETVYTFDARIAQRWLDGRIFLAATSLTSRRPSPDRA